MSQDFDIKKQDVETKNTRERILDTAAEWFRSNGLAFTSMADLARSIGVKTSSIYYYFESKDALIEETFRIGIELVHRAVQEAVEALGPDAPHRDRMKAAFAAHIHSLLGENSYAPANIMNYSHATAEVRERNKAVRIAYGRYWASLLRAAQQDGVIAADIDLSVIRMLLIGAMNWMPEWFTADGKSPEVVAEYLCLMVDGLAPARQDRAGRS